MNRTVAGSDEPDAEVVAMVAIVEGFRELDTEASYAGAALGRGTVEAGHLRKHCCRCGTTWEVEP